MQRTGNNHDESSLVSSVVAEFAVHHVLAVAVHHVASAVQLGADQLGAAGAPCPWSYGLFWPLPLPLAAVYPSLPLPRTGSCFAANAVSARRWAFLS